MSRCGERKGEVKGEWKECGWVDLEGKWDKWV